MFQRPDRVRDPLYVVTTVFNPVRYRRRWDLYQKFADQVEKAGAVLYTVEVAFADREFSVTEPTNPRHLQLRTTSEIWHKEAALNLLIERLPRDWKYVAWVDADVHFVRTDWVGETLHQLQHFRIVQMFREAQDLGPDFEPFQRHLSFAYCYRRGLPKPPANHYYGGPPAKAVQTWHPGFAWAIRRDAFDGVGRLIDWALLGAGDNHMAKAIVGDVRDSMHPQISNGYRRWCLEWERRAIQALRKDLGYVDGMLLHYWHGPKTARHYWDRWQILTKTQFDPFFDLKKDWQGLYQLDDRGDDRSIAIRDLCRDYFRARCEDSIDLPDHEVRM